MSRLSPRVFLAAGILAALAGGTFLTLVGARTAALADGLEDLSGKIEQAERKERLARSIEVLARDTAIERARLDEFFVDRDGIAPFLGRVEELGRERGLRVEIASVSVDKPAPGAAEDFFEPLRVTAVARGDFPEAHAFLALIESLPYPVLVKEARLEIPTGPRETGREWRATATFTVAKLR